MLVVAGRWLGMVHVTPRHVNQITPMRGCWTSHAGAAVAAPHPSDEGRFLIAIPSTPTMSVPESRTWRRPGVMSTAEIKARVEAMYADDRRPNTPTAR